MEQISKMAIEVNKLIGGKLLAGKSVFLPQVGSLYITMTSSQRKRVEFCSAVQGDSIVDIIIARAKCSDAEGENIYNRYLEEVRQGNLLSIMGVGELRAKSFATEDSFAKQLNSTPVSPVVVPKVATVKDETKVVAPTPMPVPMPVPAPAPEVVPEPASPIARQAVETPKQHTPSAETAPVPKAQQQKKEEKKSNKKGIIIILLLIALAVVAYLLYGCLTKKESAEPTKESSTQVTTKVVEIIETTETEEVATETATSDSLKSQALVEELENEEPATEQKATKQDTKTSLRFRVVYGVFDSQANINRAIKKIDKQYGEGSARTYRYGKYMLVSMFESDNRDECQAFLMRNLREYQDIWIHERKW